MLSLAMGKIEIPPGAGARCGEADLVGIRDVQKLAVGGDYQRGWVAAGGVVSVLWVELAVGADREFDHVAVVVIDHIEVLTVRSGSHRDGLAST